MNLTSPKFGQKEREAIARIHRLSESRTTRCYGAKTSHDVSLSIEQITKFSRRFRIQVDRRVWVRLQQRRRTCV